ncbi:MAG: DUF2339 domain-containing protein [Bacillota bacterium]
MDYSQKLKELLESQKKFAQEYEALVKDFDNDSIIENNRRMKKEIDDLKKSIEELHKSNKELKNENSGLKTALSEQVLDEKLNILKISKEKLRIYFRDEAVKEGQALLKFEQRTRERLDRIAEIASKELNSDSREIEIQIENLRSNIQNKIREHRAKFQNALQENRVEAERYYKEMEAEGVDQETIQRRIKNNNLEIKIGLNWLNKIGILVLLVGFSTLMRYAYSNYFTSEMKGAFVFLGGLIFIVAGEILLRKGKDIFAMGLCGGGIGILYISVFHSFFNLDIINLNTALGFSVLITAGAVALSIRYNSMTISSLSIIGGFLPFFTYVFVYGLGEKYQYFGAFVYLFLINLITLIISLKKKWHVVNYISFALNVPSMVFLVFSFVNKWDNGVYTASGYVMATFVMYLTVSMAYPLMHKITLKALDIVLVGLNTFVSCVSVFSLFGLASKDYDGIISIVFCLLYLGLGRLVSRYIKEETMAKGLFYLTSYTFAVIAIPFQLGLKWFAIGWLVEGVFLIIYGYRNKYKYIELGGWIVYALCFIGVLGIDFYRYEIYAGSQGVPHFHFRYAIVIGSLVYLTYIYLKDTARDIMLKYTARGKLSGFLKYFAVINVWIYLVYSSNKLYNSLVSGDAFYTASYDDFFKGVIFALVTIGLGYAIIKIPLVLDKGVKVLSVSMHILADFVLISLNISSDIYLPKESLGLSITAITILIAFNIYLFINIRSIMLDYILSRRSNLEYYPVIMAIYLLANVTAVLNVQFGLGELNMIFSILYVCGAFLCIVYGFAKKYVYIRRFGLVLSVFSTAKLFIYDLSFLETWMKILSYFAFGAILIAISYIYQTYSKKMGLRGGDGQNLAKGESETKGM